MADITPEAALQQLDALGQPAAQEAGPQTPPPTQVTVPSEADVIQRLGTENRTDAVVSAVKASTPPATEHALSTAEKILQPLLNIGSAVGSAIAGATADTSRPEVRAILGERPGIPLDIESGASFMDRLATQFTFNRAETEFVLRRQPGVEDVRFNSLGDPVLTIKDPKTGATRDVLANPTGLDTGDFAFVLANAPGLLTGARAALGRDAVAGASKVAQWFFENKGIVPSVLRSAAVTEGVNAGTDMLSRAASGLDASPAAVLKQRGESALVDVLFGSAVGLAAKGAGRVITPMGQRGPIQMNAEAAADLWRGSGIDFHFTPGEATGAPILQRTEAFAAQKPGSSGVFNNLQTAKRDTVTEMQRIMLGTDPKSIPAADLVGERALAAIGNKLRPIDSIIDRTTQEVLDAAGNAIKSNVAEATTIPENLAVSAVGQDLINTASTRLDDFRAASKTLYDKVYTNPAIASQGRNIDATPLANDAKQLLASVASVEKEGATQPLTSFVDSSTRTKLEQLASAEGGTISLRDLVELRRDIDDDLFRGSALGGIPERRLSDIRSAITQRIETGLNEIDTSGALLKDWQSANTHYAENITRFKALDILPMFKDAEQRGALDVYDVVRKAFNDPGKWEAYKGFYGPDSPQINMLRRAYADKIVGRVVGSDTVDAAGFAQRLQSAFNAQPEIVNDVFGSRLSALKKLGDVASDVTRVSVNANDLAREVQAGTLTHTKLKQLALAQAVRQDTYRNALLEKMSKGEFEAVPSKFVDNFVFADHAQPKDVEAWVSLVNDQPDLLNEVRQRTLLKIFNDSTSGPVGKETLTSSGLEKFLGDEQIVKRLRPVLGDETLGLLRATRDVLLPGELKERIFAAAGGISGGMKIAALENALLKPGSMIGEIGGILKSFLIASLYKAGPTRAWLSNNILTPGFGSGPGSRAAFVNAWVASAPVLKDMANVLGGEAARVGTLQLKAAIDSDLRRGQKSDLSPEEALKQLNTVP